MQATSIYFFVYFWLCSPLFLLVSFPLSFFYIGASVSFSFFINITKDICYIHKRKRPAWLWFHQYNSGASNKSAFEFCWRHENGRIWNRFQASNKFANLQSPDVESVGFCFDHFPSRGLILVGNFNAHLLFWEGFISRIQNIYSGYHCLAAEIWMTSRYQPRDSKNNYSTVL